LAALAAPFVLAACEATPPPAPAVRNFIVFFDFDRSTLTPRAMDIVKEAANTAKTGQSARVTCAGHTGTAGSANYNMALSVRRANAVKNALVDIGVPASSISVDAKGETSPRVQTLDDVREPQNRRVDIVIEWTKDKTKRRPVRTAFLLAVACFYGQGMMFISGPRS